jgi:hypothetical protein
MIVHQRSDLFSPFRPEATLLLIAWGHDTACKDFPALVEEVSETLCFGPLGIDSTREYLECYKPRPDVVSGTPRAPIATTRYRTPKQLCGLAVICLIVGAVFAALLIL